MILDKQRLVQRLPGRTQRQLEGRVATILVDNGDGTVDIDLAGATLTVPVITAPGVGDPVALVVWDGNLVALTAFSAASAYVPLLVLGDPDTFIDQTAGADTISVTAGGVEIARFSEGTDDQFLVGPTGSATVPSVAWITDPDTGFSRSASGQVTAVTNGVRTLDIAATVVTLYGNSYTYYQVEANMDVGWPGIQFKRSRGTAGSKTVVVNGSEMMQLVASGWDGADYDQGAWIINTARQTWSATAHGNQWTIYTTADGSTTVTARVIIYEGLQVGAPTGGDKGAGTINAAGSIYVNNSIVYLASQHTSGAHNGMDHTGHTLGNVSGHDSAAHGGFNHSGHYRGPTAGTIALHRDTAGGNGWREATSRQAIKTNIRLVLPTDTMPQVIDTDRRGNYTAWRNPVLGLTPVRFKSIPDSERGVTKDYVGFIAEEVAEVFPEAANYDEDGRPHSWDTNIIVASLLAKVKEQEARIATLEAA